MNFVLITEEDDYTSNFFSVAIIVTHKPMAAIITKEMRRLKSPAITPINGGPIKNPKNPIVDTAAMATPADMTFDLPAALYTRGTTEEPPKPTKKKSEHGGNQIRKKNGDH